MTLPPRSKAPRFELQVVSRDQQPETEQFSLSRELERGSVLAIFAKRSCPTCQWCLPLLDRLYRNYKEAQPGVVLILQSSREEAQEFVREYHLEMPVLIDPEPHPVSEAYEIEFVPTSFWIEPDSVIEQVIEAFERESFNQVNRRLATLAGVSPKPLFLDSEQVPAFRPG